MAIIIARGAVSLVEGGRPAKEEFLILGLTLAYGFIGFIDDFRQIRLGRSLGLRAREKMALQLLFAAVFMYFFADRGSYVIFPFSGRALHLGILYPVLGILLIVGTANGMNFTDGLDGLAAGVATAGLGAYAFIAEWVRESYKQAGALGPYRACPGFSRCAPRVSCVQLQSRQGVYGRYRLASVGRALGRIRHCNQD